MECITRRQAVKLLLGAALLGAIGGITSNDEGRKPSRASRESGGEEPP